MIKSNNRKEEIKAFEKLLDIMDELREKCPWDKKQTLDSLRILTIEEVYELSEAIMSKDYDSINEEIGDLYLHLVFYAKMGFEMQKFDNVKILHNICEKLIHRHPHIYGDTIVADAEEVKKNWGKLKLEEGNKMVMDGVPKGLPSIIKATRIQEKASDIGFDWKNKEDVWEKVEEEINELKVEIKNNDLDKIEDEIGDIFFALINYCRFQKIDPDTALEKTNKKFLSRFNYIENQALDIGKKISDFSLDEMEKYWLEAKQK